jgi:hypothetical protein
MQLFSIAEAKASGGLTLRKEKMVPGTYTRKTLNPIGTWTSNTYVNFGPLRH